MSSATNGMNGAIILSNSSNTNRKSPNAFFLFLERLNHQLDKSSTTNFSIALAAGVGSYLSKLSATSPSSPFNFDKIHLSNRVVGRWSLVVGSVAYSSQNLTQLSSVPKNPFCLSSISFGVTLFDSPIAIEDRKYHRRTSAPYLSISSITGTKFLRDLDILRPFSSSVWPSTITFLYGAPLFSKVEIANNV